MNKNVIILGIACLGLLLNACRHTDEKDLAAKKQKLTELKTKQKELIGQIEVLEKEIAKLDTAFKVERKVKLVQVDELSRQDFKHFIEVQGNVDAAENIIALCQQPGIVTAIYVKEGDRVAKGQVLAITETTAAMESAVQTIQTQLELASTAFEKQSRLWEQKIGSEIQYLQSKTQKEALEKQLAAQKAQLEMTKVIAPISGTVDEVRFKVGDMAAPSQLMPGVRIINQNKLSVKAKLADSDFGKIKENDKVEVEFPDIQKTITERVSHVQRTIDPRSRTFNVEVKLSQGLSEYAANMIAKLKINDATFKNVLLVPTNVIQKSSEGYYVLIAEKKGDIHVATKRLIKPGTDYAGRTVVESGLNDGDKVITFGYTEVVDGQRIDF